VVERETPEERSRRFGRIDDAVAAIEDLLFPVTQEEELTARRLLCDQDGGGAAELSTDLLRQLKEALEGPR
jgi:hypothetical protein